LLDYADVVVHIFLDPVRKFYDLEGFGWMLSGSNFKRGNLGNRKIGPQKRGVDKRTLSRFKKILLKERDDIIGEVKQISESSKEMGQDGIQDIGDEAANIYNSRSCSV